MSAAADEVWRLLRELVASQRETDREIKATDRQIKETDRQIKETDRQLKETDLSLKALKELSQDTDRRIKETDLSLKALKELSQDTDRRIKATDRQIKELGKQIGGLGEKFGGFTEGLALPSMERLLRRRFGMEVVSPRVRVTKAGRHLEIDVLSYANGALNQAYLVEVKSHLREEAIEQLKVLLRQFRDFFPEHRDKRLYGILAAVDLSPEARALREGLYVARIQDQVFALDVPEDFQPQAY
jgi:hypothetical protein